MKTVMQATLSVIVALSILIVGNHFAVAQSSNNLIDTDASPETSQAIVVPPGFAVTKIVDNLSPVSWPSYWKSLQDLEAGIGEFGDYLYYINDEVVYRIKPQNRTPETFASVPTASVMDFGFNGDLFIGAADAKGTVYRVKPDRSVTKFAEVGSSTEGMTFDGQYLYFSEWNISGPGEVSRIDANGQTSSFTQPNTVGLETGGLEFCRSVFPLYVIDQSGTIFEVNQSGVVKLFAGIDLNTRMYNGETIPCSNPQTLFGNYLYIAEQRGQPAGRILRVSFDGNVEVFASGFQGFDLTGVTGLKFSPDGRTLYVTDDIGRAIYAITALYDTIPTCQTAFSDEFNTTLDPQWSFVDPNADATQSVAARSGYLRMTAPTGNDLYPVTNYNAPRLLQRVAGDFAIETHIEFAPAQGYQGAGLLVWQDDNNFLRLERGNAGIESPDVSGIRLDIEQNGVYDAVAPTSQRPTPTTNFELRLQRNGSRFMGWWREPGQAWDYIGGTDTAFNDELLIGLALISEYGVTQTTADYDYFHITCPSILTPPVNLQARVGLNAVLLSWEPSASFGVVGYHLYRQAAGETTFARLTNAPVTGLVYRDATVTNATTSYTYYVTAVNAAGQESDPSNTVTVTPGRLTLLLPTVYAQPGMTTTVAANLENGDGLCIGAMDLGIRYNPQVAQATQVLPTALTQGYTFNANFTRPHETHIASIGNCQPLRGPGALIEVDFAVRTTAAVSTPLTFIEGLTGTVLYDSGNLVTPLSLKLINGQLLLSANGGYKRGDLNGDSVVNASDAGVALQIAAGALLPTPAQRSAGDVNGDGVINAGDAAMILYFVANQLWPSAALAQALAASTGNAPIQLQPLAVAGDRGQKVEVPLQINQGEQVAGATLIARYGRGLTYERVELDTFRVLQGYTITVNAIGASELRISLVGRQPLPTGSQTLGSIHFGIDPDATNEQTQVAVIGAWLTDQTGRDFSLSALAQTVVGGESAVRINERVLLPLIRR